MDTAANDPEGDGRLATALAQLAQLEGGERRASDDAGMFAADPMPFGTISSSLDFGEFLDRQRRFLQVGRSFNLPIVHTLVILV